jgi:elongation factor P
MNTENYEQTFIDKSMISAPELLKEGEMVQIAFHTETDSAISCEMPTYVTLKVTYTEPGEKGNTATNTFKDAVVETGATVKVPLFINEGDLVKIDTRSGEYSERVKA